jgi:prolyl oligopeptidase
VKLAYAAMAAVAMNAAAQQAQDPYLWLEDVTGEKALAWVRERNAEAVPKLEGQPGFKAAHERLLSIYNSRSRIPAVAMYGGRLYNFWQDAAHPRGIWRRTTLEEFRKPEPAWETVLDVGKLSDADKERWVFKGAECLYPDYKRCMVSLSRGGADATVVREFDLERKAFVPGGFELPESKGGTEWRDADTLYVARDFGKGTMTSSGYPRIVKEWKRGTPLEKAAVVFEGREDDVGSQATVVQEKIGRQSYRHELIHRSIEFFRGEDFIRRGDRFEKLDTPADAKVTVARNRLMVQLRSDWTPGKHTYRAGSLLAIMLDKYFAGDRDYEVVFEPGERTFLQGWAVTRKYLLLEVLDNVKGRVMQGHRHYGKMNWREVPVPAASTVAVAPLERNESDDYWLTTTGFVQPTTLSYVDTRRNTIEPVKSLPVFFDAKGLEVAQHEAASRDGTKVPYFVVSRSSPKRDGGNPTILYGYGGFEVQQKPAYNAAMGAAWLEQGGTWVLANLRGGGEFGPAWHRAARREGRQKTHDDFIAVAEDLVKRGISSPRHLGVYGGSQGGLLVGAVVTQRPDLFRAAVATVPLFDMKRYHKLPAGASWMAEYGNPDVPGDWEFISKYSPYQNVKKGTYPKMFITTTTRDDRVHPGHARKMVARLKEFGHDVLYYENIEGGHGLGSTPEQNAYAAAMIYTFFASELR